ncbi:pyruvate dehydrogenase E1 component alpha subunit [Halohasta litchfieldiae]|uniref:Pyruvate dehydrogenase E1 component alpha subunit n=1 Tax=Halohasta litchfieldiae TaxID=1073996 RepID=A0A1H6TKM5_9EURY|nr:pyruvate dehydrogenase (acetyl-transferring) E1 component subunit alpha [Halohasta litchfieldiae]ATW88896.1 pyruvate dehydrogenase E1 component alpha subunit [Halohasta litchfieldiae]SEI80633.1 pyruvate dehydrogenase E1 component alpha subunit [Halohasta litchfieldiae]
MSTLQREPGERVQILDESGSVVGDLPEISDERIVDIYADMVLARHLDGRAVSLQRQGRMGTYPPMSGQEAAQVGSAYALDDPDWIFPSYREHAASTVRGMPLERTILYWMGNANGMDTPEDLNIFPIAVPIATQILHAVGMAWASRLTGHSDEAFVAYFGDGATSEGDFHEALNFAGVFDTPTVFFCNNNQWAISVPRERQTASETLAQKATAYGFEGVEVDGMDPLAVYSVTKQAVEKAKNPDADELRPTLIEAVQYRFGAHTTADDPSVYRDDAEVDDWRAKDPIARLESFCRDRGLLDDETVTEINEAVRSRVTEAIEAAESTARPGPEELFDQAYARPPPELEQQYAALEALREQYGDEVFLQ